MKVRIIKTPPRVFDGISLHLYRVGGVFEMTPALANYLVAEGYAVFELRHEHSTQTPAVDRRKKR